MIVVVPLNDSHAHDLENTMCKCKPKVEFPNGHLMIVHNQFDARILTEWLTTDEPERYRFLEDK